MGVVQLSDIRKEYGDVVAVNETNLTIQEDELITFVGPSGCGKTTSLELVAGLEQPTDGTVTINGEVVNGKPPMARNIAMVFQNIALYPHKSVRGNMEFPLKLRNFSKDAINSKVEQAANLLNISDLINRSPSELSGGQQQRVGIGRAIVREPDVFLLDEPLANLDAKLRVEMRTEIQRIQRELETTMIYVTHDQLEAMTISDRIVVMNGGDVIQVGEPTELYMSPGSQFVAGFIGSPSMNFIPSVYNKTTKRIESGPISFSIESRNITTTNSVKSNMTLGIRHEDIYLRQEHAEAQTPSSVFNATIQLIEPAGEYKFLYLDIDQEKQLLMSVDPLLNVQESEDVEVILDIDRLHLFDQESGKSILTSSHQESNLSNRAAKSES